MKEKIMFILKAIANFFVRLYKAVFGSKKEKIKNKHLFKRGGYAIAVIALVIAGTILFNMLVGFLADRITLEYDLTTEKKSTISKENKEYIKSVDKEVNLYIFAKSAEDYYSGGMAQAAQTKMFYTNNSEYYFQTTVLLEQYGKLNDKISIEYVDPNGTEVSAIISEYGTNYAYGDILVTCKFKSEDGNEIKNFRSLNISDIYTATEDDTYAAMGVTMYEIDGSNLETALTSAIASVISAERVKVGFIASHSRTDAFTYLRSVLELNNIEVVDINDTLVTKISDELDAVIIAAPTMDFAAAEITALGEYLSNDDKLGKNLIFYGDSSYQNLPNLYNFLAEWGLVVEPGIVLETNDSLHMEADYSTYLSLSATSDFSFISAGQYFASGYNIGLTASEDAAYAGREINVILSTNGTSALVPVKTDVSKKPEGYEMRKFASCAMSTESEFVDNVPSYSRVVAFSSVDFISELYSVSYKSMMDYDALNIDIIRFVTGVRDTSIVFEAKKLDATSELYVVSSSSAKVVRVIFAAVIPVAILVVAFVIFFRRRNK